LVLAVVCWHTQRSVSELEAAMLLLLLLLQLVVLVLSCPFAAV
jgi:hypothetical protein